MRLLALIACVLAGSTWAADRFAVVVGHNVGNPRRAVLWFAQRDAQRFARTLTELGDFPADHLRLLTGTRPDEVREALASLEAPIAEARQAGRQTVLVFYFSGHAGAGALELGGESIAFGELKQLVESSMADVKVAIVDACESGALTQVKGAKPNAADFPLPSDESARGVAWLASTAVGEVAQESASIGGSFFTFHLETALRGAGDANGDGQVSLGEAFQYTSSRTVTGTSTTDTGPQHPTYNFRMSGRGDVVLSDLRRAEASLALPGDSKSTWVVSSGGKLVAEAAGGLTLALPAGSYRLEHRVGRETFGGELVLSKGETRQVGELPRLDGVAGRGKGGDLSATSIFAGASLASPVMTSLSVLPGVRVGLRQGLGAWGLRLTAGYETGGGLLTDGATAYRLHTVSLEGAVLRRLVDSVVWLDLGVALGGAWNGQELPGGTGSALSGLGAGTVSFGVPLGRFSPQLQVSGGGRVFQLNDAPVVRGFVSGTLALAVDL